MQAKLAEISEDLSDEAKASAAAKVNLWAAKEKLEDIEDMIYELRNRRVAPKATPMKVLQAVVYIAGHKHSELVDPYARKKNQVASRQLYLGLLPLSSLRSTRRKEYTPGAKVKACVCQA